VCFTFGDVEGVVLNNSITVFFIDVVGEFYCPAMLAFGVGQANLLLCIMSLVNFVV
jgi:hypothetical protein